MTRYLPLFLLLFATGLTAADLKPVAAPPSEIAIEVIFGESQLSSVAISPTGRYLAMLRPHNNRRQVFVVDLEKGSAKRLTDMTEENVYSVRWIKDERLAFFMQYKGQESFGIYAVNADGTNLRVLRQAQRLNSAREVIEDGSPLSIVDWLPEDPDDAIVGQVRGRSGLADLYRLNVHTEKLRKLENNPGTLRDWVIDHAGVPRVGIANAETEDMVRTFYRSTRKSEWKEIATFDPDSPDWMPLRFDADNRTLFVTSNIGRKTRGIFRLDPETGRMGAEVYSDDTYDVSDVIYSRSKQRLLGVSYDAEKPRVVWLDPEMKALQTDIDGALPGTLNTIVSSSRNHGKVVISASSDRDPGAYYLLDTTTFEMSLIGRTRPEIDPAQMAEMRPIVYQARDGLTIHGYITLPAGREPRNLPLIIVPHGGPFGPRDSWGFNEEVQFLANRGIAVLQVNFRGSGGYGEWFERAGWGKWGLEMQDDLTDGVKWAIEQGFANPKRIAIYGGSYGGYAAMMGIIKDPDLYRCAVNYVGVTDLSIILEGFSNMGKRAQHWRANAIAHPVHDADRIAATSPLRMVERIQVPVLMAYGYFDPRVTLEHGNLLEKAMRRHGKQVEYMVEEGEGHGFGKYENRLKFYGAMERFLKEHLLAKNAEVRMAPTQVIEMPARE